MHAFVRMALNNLLGSDVVIVFPVAGSDVAASRVYCALRQLSVKTFFCLLAKLLDSFTSLCPQTLNIWNVYFVSAVASVLQRTPTILSMARPLAALKEPSAKWTCPSQSLSRPVEATSSPPSIELNEYNTIRLHLDGSMVLTSSGVGVHCLQ